ncbi:ATP-binding protein [Pseudarthrobacter sp. N5]|uniref:ATP-binding protein n=1 Tax=Pseudarthrobacter sp. N5 TaxID=3418416 RepID=UPI003CF9899B
MVLTHPAETPLKPRTAIVADPDIGRLAATAAALREAGFSVATAPDRAVLSELLKRRTPSIVVADHSLAELQTSAPLLVLIDLADGSEAEGAKSLGIADYITKPPCLLELVHRADTLISRATQRTDARQGAERLRERLRMVSAAVRATNDPQLIAEHLVNGFGETFKADRVWFTTFEDDRVPLVRAQWHRPDLPPLAPELGAHEEAAHSMSDRLWAEADVLTVDDHRNHHMTPDERGLHGWTQAMHPRASAMVPVGEGKSSLGVIWIAQLDAPRAWSRAEIALIQHVAGNVAYGLIQSHLISAQQQVVKQLQQLDQAKTDFLATVNHELRTPLTSITAYLDMIQDGVGGPLPPDVDRMLDIIVRNAERLRLLVQDMLTVSHQDYDGSSLHLAPLRMGHTLGIVTDALRPLAELRDVSISLGLSVEDPLIIADEVQLEQVFTNLVSNAIKFTPSGGRITVTSVQETVPDGAPHVTVRVADTGVGIPGDEIPHLFTRFYRASNAGAVPGSGLGLAIAHDVVNRHRGHMRVHSEMGAGTAITVSFPVAGP